MKTLLVIGIILGAFALILGVQVYSGYSEALQDQVAIKTSSKNLEGIFDNTYKKISQTTQIAKFDRDSLRDIIVGNAQARAGNGSGGQIMQWIKESVPQNIPQQTLLNVQNIIVGARDEYTERQTAHNDKVRVYNQRLNTVFVGRIFLKGIFGLKEVDEIAITSGHTKQAFQTGEDNDIDLGLNKK